MREVKDGTHPSRRKLLTCSICRKPIEMVAGWAGGHNAQPINNGRCCGDCNAMMVVPARIIGSKVP